MVHPAGAAVKKLQPIPDMRKNGAYVARKSCGCCVGVATDCRDKDTAKSVAEWIGHGLIVTHVEWTEYINTIRHEPTFMECPHCGQSEAALPLFAEVQP